MRLLLDKTLDTNILRGFVFRLQTRRVSYPVNYSSMSLYSRFLPTSHAFPTGTFASSSAYSRGRSITYRRIHTSLYNVNSSRPRTESGFIAAKHLLQINLRSSILSTKSDCPPIASRAFSSRCTLYHARGNNDENRINFKGDDNAGKHSEEEFAKASSGARSQQSSEGAKEKSNGDQEKGEREKKDAPAPPPHGDKTPLQVFMETLRNEFKASKEWNDSTKALASSAHQFTENESIRKARAAYTAASGAATSTTSSALRNTGKALGQGAAWTWDTPVIKGVRAGVNVTAKGIDMATKPVRETQAYQKAVGNVKNVIDDGSSSRYGGWVEKEERRKQRELRELNESQANGGPGKRNEKIKEDPK